MDHGTASVVHHGMGMGMSREGVLAPSLLPSPPRIAPGSHRRTADMQIQMALASLLVSSTAMVFLNTSSNNSTIFAAAADIVLALTCDLDIPKRKTVELSVGPKGIQAKHTRTTIMLSGPKGASASTNTASRPAKAPGKRSAL